MSVNMNSERSSAVKIGEWTFAAYMAVEHAFCDYFSKTTNWAPEYLFSCYQCRDGFASKVSTSCLYLSYHVAVGHTSPGFEKASCNLCKAERSHVRSIAAVVAASGLYVSHLLDYGHTSPCERLCT